MEASVQTAILTLAGQGCDSAALSLEATSSTTCWKPSGVEVGDGQGDDEGAGEVGDAGVAGRRAKEPVETGDGRWEPVLGIK